MRMRLWCLSALFVAVSVWTGPAAAVEFNIGGGGSGPYDFSSLETLRIAMEANPNLVGDGDVINLHGNDSSLTQPFFFPAGARVTLRSVGGRHTITGLADPKSDAWFGSEVDYDYDAAPPQMIFDNVRIADNERLSASAISIVSNHSDMGILNVTNSIIENNLEITTGAINIFGNVNATITNSIIRNNEGYGAGAIALSNFGAGDPNGGTGGPLVLNLVFDGNAPLTTTWEGNGISDGNGGKSANSISIQTYPHPDSSTTINVNVAGDRIFNLRDPLSGNIGGDSTLDINKIGAGTWKLDGLNAFLVDQQYERTDELGNTETVVEIGNLEFNVLQGKFHARETMIWTGLQSVTTTVDGVETTQLDYTGGGHFSIAKDAIFKPSVTMGTLRESEGVGEGTFTADATRMILNSFNTVEGSKLEVGNISTFDLVGERFVNTDTPTTTWMRYSIITTSEGATVSSTMRVDNALMRAWLETEEGNENDVFLTIDYVADLATLKGVGGGIDAFRKIENLPDHFRDWLDDIYNRGYLTGNDRGNIQTFNGDTIMLSQLAMRHNFAGALQRINQRVTAFQNEELEIGHTCNDVCYTDNSCLRSGYGEMWAYISKSWMEQDDRDNIAGYKYNPYGIGIGYDYHSDEWIIGGLLQYDDGTVKLTSRGATRTDTQTLIASGYASWAREGYYITGGVHAGHGWNKSKSVYVFPGAHYSANTGNYSTSLFGLSTEVGYMAELGGDYLPLRITPYMGLAYGRLTREALTESGAGILNRRFRRSEWDLYDFSLGVRFSKPYAWRNMILIPSADLGLVRTMGRPGAASGGDVHLIDYPGYDWKIDTFNKNGTALRGNAALNAQVRENLDIGVSYNFEWRRQFWSNQWNVNMSLDF